jgi:hypothetical protein
MISTDELLHIVARIAVRLWPPLTAKRRIDKVAALVKPIDIDEATRLTQRLRGGTCLTRSLAIAARLPGSEVVVGVSRAQGSPLRAHAWVEAQGLCIGEPEPTELARLK